MGDCPECEYCCIIGLCCPEAKQHDAIVTLLVREGLTETAARQAADSIVAARKKAQKS